ncbi:MAG: hypothetical protein DRP01_00215 [Archaeoglobales archaeon]|nr:MAG: hypothetical protein DRP01_00215 [Archaeoglobales archaeon]
MADNTAATKDEMSARTYSDTCVRCRKKLKPGHRTQFVYIVERVGRHPTNLQAVGAYMMRDEFEVAHIECTDPYLRDVKTGVE